MCSTTLVPFFFAKPQAVYTYPQPRCHLVVNASERSSLPQGGQPLVRGLPSQRSSLRYGVSAQVETWLRRQRQGHPVSLCGNMCLLTSHRCTLQATTIHSFWIQTAATRNLARFAAKAQPQHQFRSLKGRRHNEQTAQQKKKTKTDDIDVRRDNCLDTSLLIPTRASDGRKKQTNSITTLSH